MKLEEAWATVRLTETSAPAKLQWHFSPATPRPQVSGHHTPATAFTKRFDPTHLLNFSDSPAVTVQDHCLQSHTGHSLDYVLGFFVTCFNSAPFPSVWVTLCALPWLPMLPKQGSSTKNCAFWLQFVLTLGLINLTWSTQIPTGHIHWTVWKEGWDGARQRVSKTKPRAKQYMFQFMKNMQT